MDLTLVDVNIFTPQIEGWKLYGFLIAVFIISGLAFIIQRAVFRALKKLGSRHINQMIIPSQVSPKISFEVLSQI